MRYTVLDAEFDGLLDALTKMHCLCATVYEDGVIIEKVEITLLSEVVPFLERQECIVGHNIIFYDLSAIRKMTGYTHKGLVIDSLALSWYLYPAEEVHGLATWGERVGILKPVVEDWTALSLEVYVHRCKEDVEINSTIFHMFVNYLQEIYQGDIKRIMFYLTWKLECIQEQIENPLTIDRDHCKAVLAQVNTEMDMRKASLSAVMPRIAKTAKSAKPKVMFKKDGTISALGIKWLELLHDNDLEADFEGEVTRVLAWEDPNPTSTSQLKAWLFTLGWVPTIYKLSTSKVTGNTKSIPQLQDKDKNLCMNITMLSETHPELEHLEGLFMLQHRIGVLEGFLECSDENGKMAAEIGGFTNTLRFRHKKPIANLPGVDKPYGKEIRGAIIAPPSHFYEGEDEEYLFCGSDMSSLEDSTKQHYMYFYDPEYVTQMRVPGFDPHIDIAVLAELITKEDEDFFKWFNKQARDYVHTSEDLKRIKAITAERKTSKVINFSGIYGAGPPKISQTTGMTLQKATVLHTIYWQRNKAVKQIAKDCVVKNINGQLWLFNPVSQFWYSLRKDKDRFSTLNQGTGVYCFDTHVKNVRDKGIKLSLQYHDEVGFPFKKKDTELIRNKLNEAIALTNDMLQLNVPLGISIDIGLNYAEAH